MNDANIPWKRRKTISGIYGPSLALSAVAGTGRRMESWSRVPSLPPKKLVDVTDQDGQFEKAME